MAFPDGWGRRCELVTQYAQVEQDCTDFPTLVHEDSLPSEIFDADGSYPALNGGGDLRFSSDEAGSSQLPCEVESFVTDNDPANGKSAVWTKRTLSSASNTSTWIWYHKSGESQPAEDSAYGKEAVYDSNFVMVQHMNQIPDGTADEIVDSTSNDNDGTTSGMDSADQVAGQVDGSLDFDGGDDYVDVPHSSELNITGNITVQIWVKPFSVNTLATIISKHASSAGYDLQLFGTSNSTYGFGISAGAGFNNAKSNDPAQVNVGSHLVGVYNGEKILLYVNGVLQDIQIASNPPSSTEVNLIISDSSSWSPRHFEGLIDEVRISNVARSAGWIATEYNNQNAPGTFLIEGTPQSPGVGVPIAVFMHHYNQMRAA